jgi:hypothetical protein
MKQIAYQLRDPNNMRWPKEYCIPIIGALTLGTGADDRIEWTVEDVSDFPFGSVEYKHTLERRVKCNKESIHNGMCTACHNSRQSLFHKCERKFELKMTELKNLFS